ncbi:MAG: hypothetical protein MUP63_03950 [Candidatus Nanohaloarchaeota archaeon QJJ-7]|nr:hypothetical protein [Candidatus Nanohaloarchaeota archaeon QJJ-7]
MSDDVLTFEELRRAQSKERDSDTLQKLEEEFFDRARRYLKIKKNPGKPLQNQEYRNAKNILQDVLDMRQKKIVKLAFLSVKSGVDVENLLPGEEELFEEMKEEIEDYREELNEEVFKELEKDVVETSNEKGKRIEEVGDTGTESSEEEIEEQFEPDDDDEEQEEDGGDETELENEVEEKGPEEASGDDGEDVEEEEASGDDREEESVDAEDSGDGASDILEFDTGDEEDEVENQDSEDTEGENEEDNRPGDDLVSIESREDIPEFMGTDLQPYGPFEEGEEVEVPEENAEVLEDQGKAERVS